MGKSCVYNSGSADDDKKDDELRLTFGVFIDGTLNNKTNTQLRRFSRNEDENSVITKEKKDADKERERHDYKKIKSGKPVDIPAGFKKNLQLYKEYLEGVDRSMFDEWGTENSYSNDDTNVARMWYCCDKKNAIYIEGMGTSTEDSHNRQDSQDGFAFGSGTTGIRARVRLACERVAENIQEIIKKKTSSKVTQITFDVFGFSRGAASARNFVHEINTKREYPVKPITIPDGYYPINPYARNDMQIPKYRNALGDFDGLEIDPKGLVDGKMPRFGHLGYSLIKNKILTPDELIGIKIIVRFIGIYDTVSSYYERDALGAYDAFGNLQNDDDIVKLVTFSDGDFENDEKELGLQELELKGDASKFQKMVHFTAQDEHRKNFALTRINQIPDRAIEKNLPGVHCDIGGAYENEDKEIIDEIGTNVKDGQYRSKEFKWKKPASFPYSLLPDLPEPVGLVALKQDLIHQYWYLDEELDINIDWGYLRLTGTRTIKKEYSYIPLHFMEEYCRQTTMREYITVEIAPKYPLGNSFLDEVKEHLHDYVFGDAPEWKFKNDAQLEKEKYEAEEKIKEETKLKEAEKEFERQKANLNSITMKTDNLNPENYRPKIHDKGLRDSEQNKEIQPTELEEVVVYGYSKQNALRELRHKYLHWSSHRDWFGMEPPNDNRERTFFPKT